MNQGPILYSAIIPEPPLDNVVAVWRDINHEPQRQDTPRYSRSTCHLPSFFTNR
jgi:hypothetical protein